MKILHVSLGDPRYRHGGLNQYCLDLMNAQKKAGHAVSLLFPGGFSIGGKTSVKSRENGLFFINNPLPVAITYGIDKPSRYWKKIDGGIYESFLQAVLPDVIHIHSIQGIHAEFFEVAKLKSIPMVFTTHDYYPMCCNCTLIDYQKQLCNCNDSSRCTVCNYQRGLSFKKQILLQSQLYQKVKGFSVIRALKNSKAVTNEEKTNMQISPEEFEKNKNDFKQLKSYYQRIFDCFSVIHANSEQAALIYAKFFPGNNTVILPITNAKIERQKHRRAASNPINFGYLGGPGAYKGYHVFENALDELDNCNHTNWNAWFYGGAFQQTETADKRRHYCGCFDRSQTKEVWENIDVLVVPSQWKETFGLVVLEALSKQIPVICSDLVGAKYLLEKAFCSELIFKYDSVFELAQKMSVLMAVENYQKIQNRIEMMEWKYDMDYHTNQIIRIYKRLLNEK